MQVDVQVAWGEMDAFAHVNNVVYFRYFENARIEYLRRIGFDNARAVGPILASTHCRFRRPVTFPDTVRVGVRTTVLGEDRFEIGYRLVSERLGEVAAEGGGVVVSYDYRVGRKAPLPEEVRRAIETLERRGLGGGQPDLESFFRDYVAAFNAALHGSGDLSAVRAAFAPAFIGAGPTQVECGRNDEAFGAALESGYEFYRSIGTRRMTLRGVEVTAIDPAHRMARVRYSSEYERKSDGETVNIDFEVVYLLQISDGRPLIFGFVSGDEQAVLRQHGLVG